MPEIKEKVYSFNELDEKIQKQLIEECRYEETESYNWSKPIIEKWKLILNKLGYDHVEIFFSGFCSQGDGACFTAAIDSRIFLLHKRHKGKFKCLVCDEVEINVKITHSWRYYYPTSTNVEFDVDEYYGEDQELKKAIHNIVINQLEEFIYEDRETLGCKIYKDLEELYEGLTSDEYIKERLQEHKFNEFGDIIEEEN